MYKNRSEDIKTYLRVHVTRGFTVFVENDKIMINKIVTTVKIALKTSFKYRFGFYAFSFFIQRAN